MNKAVFFIFCLNNFFVGGMESPNQSPNQSPNVKIRTFRRSSSDKINEADSHLNKSGSSLKSPRGRRQSLDRSSDEDSNLNKLRGGSPIPPRVRKQSFGSHPEFIEHKYNQFAKEENLTIENLKKSSDDKK